MPLNYIIRLHVQSKPWQQRKKEIRTTAQGEKNGNFCFFSQRECPLMCLRKLAGN